jgi:hypothetical protein
MKIKAEEIYDLNSMSIAELFIRYEKAVTGNAETEGEYEFFRNRIECLAIAGRQMERIGFSPTREMLRNAL